MALIKCHECGKEISDTAPTCPGCGAPKKKLTVLEQEVADDLSPAERARRAKNRAEWGFTDDDVNIDDAVAQARRALTERAVPQCPLCGGSLRKMGGVEGLFRAGFARLAKKHRCTRCGHLA